MSITSVLRWGLAGLAGLAMGAASAWWATGSRSMAHVQGHPEWLHDRSTGSVDAGPYTRARIARFGLLALNRNEALYYLADRDDEGNALREACTYEVDGAGLPSQWWSLTLYAQDMYLARNDDRAASVGTGHVAIAADGRWSVRVATQREDAANWLSTRHAGDFTLGLRLYRPATALIEGKQVPELPSIHRLACAGARA
jgi:hypothetical protein